MFLEQAVIWWLPILNMWIESLILFIDIVANIYNFDFRFRGNDARLIKGTLLLGLLVTLQHLIVFQMQIKPMQLLLQQYIEYTKNNNNSRLTLYIKWFWLSGIKLNMRLWIVWKAFPFTAVSSFFFIK